MNYMAGENQKRELFKTYLYGFSKNFKFVYSLLQFALILQSMLIPNESF